MTYSLMQVLVCKLLIASGHQDRYCTGTGMQIAAPRREIPRHTIAASVLFLTCVIDGDAPLRAVGWC